jgi:hypothetical protein
MIAPEEIPETLAFNTELSWLIAPEDFRRERLKKNSMVSVRERTIPTERPPLVDEVIPNFCG